MVGSLNRQLHQHEEVDDELPRGDQVPHHLGQRRGLLRAFGVLKLKLFGIGAARALVILDQEGRMVHMSLHNEYTRSYPWKVVDLIKHLSTKEMLRLDSRNSIPDQAQNGLIKSPAKASVLRMRRPIQSKKMMTRRRSKTRKMLSLSRLTCMLKRLIKQITRM